MLPRQFQQPEDLGATQRAGSLQHGELPRFGLDTLFLTMEVLDGVVQSGLLFDRYPRGNFGTIFPQPTFHVGKQFTRLVRMTDCR